MLRYVIGRLMQAPVSLFIVVVAVFTILNLTGDPVLLYLGVDATHQQILELRARLGLDDPPLVQFSRFVAGVFRGDFGRSLRYDKPALSVVLDHLWPTLSLGLVAFLLAFLVGTVLGLGAALRKSTWIDHAIGSISSLGLSMPSFWLGIMLISAFAVGLRWLPTSGIGTTAHYILPSITLAAYFSPQFALFVRVSILETLRQPYVATARSKGLHAKRVLINHVMRNALPPLISFVALQLATILGGAVITETIFAWPGVGRLAIEAVSQRDVPIVAAAVVAMSLGTVVLNLAADLAIAFVDPRIRYG